MTSIPASVHTAMVPAALKSTSSGWALITRIRWISESSSMAPCYGGSAGASGPHGRVPHLNGQFAFPADLRRRQGRLIDNEAVDRHRMLRQPHLGDPEVQ